ncbi:MAG: phosphotransferase [Calditrichaceae bacterium]|nr:phosphotransferase [Calditrichaceae bacterium]MBN2709055.1 phosphotransferase [Calditrichaceae bacterium]RQV97013.1 MAG: phosphotransferase enzyme family protein [Calditrichota bacterium]
MKTDKEILLRNLFENWAGEKAENVLPLTAHGSNREYYRIIGGKKQAIGAYNPDLAENKAFISFSRHFKKMGLNVPEVYAENLENHVYLVQDLGDITLFDFRNSKNGFTGEVNAVYEHVIDILPEFQIRARKGLDFSICFPRDRFDRQSMQWDLNYFKYYFLKPAAIAFHEQELENDFQSLTDFLLTADQDYFLYRDFQSRNIMIYEGQPYFLDYQGGRKGSLHYDLASLLFDAKADIPPEQRNALLERYIKRAGGIITIDRQKFIAHYYGYVLIRILQALGAYGYRGFYERKTHFLQSVPFAQKNIAWLLDNNKIPVKLPALMDVLQKIADRKFVDLDTQDDGRLTVRIYSFSYKKGLPQDDSGNGGGFVFDCRFLPNPGRYPEYKNLTGSDAEVIKFLEKEPAVHQFMQSTQTIVDNAVDNYLSRRFNHLMVCFGCTGGQHRSVYFADRMAAFLKNKYNINVILKHRERDTA